MPRGDTTAARARAAARRSRRASRHVEREGAQTHIVAGTTAVPHGDPRRFPLLLLSMLLGGGMSSRLFQRVREELGLAYSVYTYQSFHADAGMHGVYVATAPEIGRRGARRDSRRASDRSSRMGLPADEIAMGRQQLKGQITLSLESVSSRMYRAASVELYGEPYRTLDELLALIDAITVEDVARVARGLFQARSADRREPRAQGDGLSSGAVTFHSLVTLVYTHIASQSHEDRRSEGNQNEREPHRPRAGRRRDARRGRTLGADRDGRRVWAADFPTRRIPLSAPRSRPTPRPSGATAT